ncbi:MAG: NifU family protein [Bradymonadales bacterium]|jgi:Fe-S cluster biogenesis protein NfuA
MRLEILKALEQLRPMIVADGGNVDFIDYFDHVVWVQLTGACESCPHAGLTIKYGLESKLQELYPEIKAVRDINLEIDV